MIVEITTEKNRVSVYETINEVTRLITIGESPQHYIFAQKVMKTLVADGFEMSLIKNGFLFKKV